MYLVILTLNPLNNTCNTRPENIFFMPGILSGRNDVNSDRGNIRPDIRQNFLFEKIRTPRVCVTLKKIWSYCSSIKIKIR